MAAMYGANFRLKTGDGSDDSDGNSNTCLAGLHPVIKQFLLPCCAFRLPDLPFVFPSPFLGRTTSGCGAATVTGTIICYEHGKVRLCLHFDPSSPPYLFLDLPLTTADFVAGIRSGGWRMSFECQASAGSAEDKPLLDGGKVWEVSLNGKTAGFATRPEMTGPDARLLHATRTVSAGAGILAPAATAVQPGNSVPSPPVATEEMRRCKYLRGTFERVVGSPDSESYHLVDPDGDLGQVLSLFFLRRR